MNGVTHQDVENLYIQNTDCSLQYSTILAPSTQALSSTDPSSPDPRQHPKPLPLILPTKILPIPSLLLLRPNPHRDYSGHHKQHRRQAPAHKTNPHPSHCFKHIIRARHQIEPQTLRNTTFSPACAAEIAEREMRIQISQLPYYE